MPVSILSLKIVLSSLVSQAAISPINPKVNSISKKAPKLSNTKKSYAQASKANISLNVKDVLQIKKAFPTSSANETGRIIKVKNSSEKQNKPRINMTTKGLLRKQVITPIAKSNAELIMNLANQFIVNINKSLKEIRSDVSANFIHIIKNGVIITTDKLL